MKVTCSSFQSVGVQMEDQTSEKKPHVWFNCVCGNVGVPDRQWLDQGPIIGASAGLWHLQQHSILSHTTWHPAELLQAPRMSRPVLLAPDWKCDSDWGGRVPLRGSWEDTQAAPTERKHCAMVQQKSICAWIKHWIWHWNRDTGWFFCRSVAASEAEESLGKGVGILSLHLSTLHSQAWKKVRHLGKNESAVFPWHQEWR